MLILTILLIYESSHQRIKNHKLKKIQIHCFFNLTTAYPHPIHNAAYYANGHYRSKIYIHKSNK